MQIATLDFETYFDQEYGLSKLSTSEYVRDKRFEVVSCAIKLNDGPTKIYFGFDKIKAALDAIDWTKTAVLAHHTHFDGLILSHHFGIVPVKYLDTLSMARAVFPKTDANDLNSVAERLGKGNKLKMPDVKGKHLKDMTPQELGDMAKYNVADVDLCYDVFQELVNDYPPEEMNLIDITVRMFADPVIRLDRPRVKAELKREIDNQAALVASTGLTEKQLGSSAALAQHLEDLGVTAPMKYSVR